MRVTRDEFRRAALAFPEAAEQETWGHPTFRVRGKMFASGSEESPTMSVKASKEDQAELVASRPETFAVARYVGRFGWVEVQLPNVDEAELRELLTDAWRRTAPKRLVKELGAP